MNTSLRRHRADVMVCRAACQARKCPPRPSA